MYRNDRRKITIITNIALLPDIEVLLNAHMTGTLDFFLSYVRYEEYESKLRTAIQGADIIMVWLNFETMQPDAPLNIKSRRKTIKEYREHLYNIVSMLYEYIKKISQVMVIWIGMDDYAYKITGTLGNVPFMGALVDYINLYTMEMLRMTDIYIDLKRIIANIGCEKAYNSTWKYRWNAPYSKQLIDKVAEEVCRQYLTYNHESKKCIILDCDNVLWGGILSECGMDGIRLGNEYGREFQDFQRFILYLYYCGIILCVCSKNDEEKVRAVFRECSAMILKEEHIACFQVGWESKVKGIKQIVEDINIGLESMIFVDDSEHEINEVRAFLPEVECLLFNKKTIYADIQLNLTDYEDVDEVKKRHMTYITNTYRKELNRKYISQEEYLKALDNHVIIKEAQENDVRRISELSFRSNRCTTGMRYSSSEIEQMMAAPDTMLYTVHVSDRFSDLGLVGAIGISRNVLIFFVLSCRAMGRGVEEMMMKHIKKMEVQEFVFNSTARNLGLFTLLIDNKFTEKKR